MFFTFFVKRESEDTIHQTTNMELDSKNIKLNILKTKPPPPIFIWRDNTFSLFCAQIKNLTKPKNFSYNSSVNSTKLFISTVESYKIVIKFVQFNDADFHIYLLK